MNTTLLNSIRTSKGFSRSVTYLIIVAVVGVVLERIIYYSLEKAEIIERENVVERINRVAPHKARQLGLPQTPTQAQIERGKSNDTKLSEAVVSVQDTLDVLAYELLNEGDPDDAQDKLTQLYNSLRDYDKQAIRDFSETEAHIEKYQLADVIKQRHEEMVLNYRTEMDALLANMSAIDSAKNADDKLDVVLTAIKQLEGKQLKRSQQPFDPENLPNRSLQPNEENKPKLTPEQFARVGLFNNPYPKYAALGDFTYDTLPGANNPAYLGESVEIKLTQAIRDQAASLNHDPVQIYNWVRNNIVWIPSWGAMQEADITLGSKRGNALDIASLHIALLRASQIPARYVHGTIDVPEEKYRNWVGGFDNIDAAGHFASSGGIPTTAIISGGKITHIRMEHIWVEAAIDFHPSRGAVNLDADSWVEMDASFKQYEHLEGLDVAAIAGIDGESLTNNFLTSGNINDQDGWISDFDPTILQNAQAQAQTAVQDYVTTNLPDATVGDVIGGSKTIIQETPGLPSSLPNSIVVTGTRYAELPNGLQPGIHVGLGWDILGQPIGGITLPWAQVNNHKVTLSYRPATQADEDVLISLIPEGEITDINQLAGSIPAYLVKVVPELKLNGVVISTGQPLTLGEELDLTFTLQHPSYGNRTYYSPVIAGSFQALTTIGGSVSTNVMQILETRITATKAKFDSNDQAQLSSIDREDLLGDMFYAGSLSYFAQYIGFTHVTGLQQKVYQGLMPSIGTYGYVPKVNYLFGFPRAIEKGGVEIDLDAVTTFTTSHDGDRNKMVSFVQQTGGMSSALEHMMPEQMFYTEPLNPPQAISAIKALGLANAQSQRIYHITPENQLTALAQVNHDSATMAEIRNALAVGKTIITHTNSLSVPGWSGAGYIILDPETGDGAYKIGGGLNGGILDELGDVVKVFSDSQGALQALMDSDKNFIDEFKNSPFYKAFNFLGKFLGVAGLALQVLEIAQSCGAEAAVVFTTILTIMFVVISALTAFIAGLAFVFAPLLAFVIQIVLQILSNYVKNLMLGFRLCPH